MYRIWVRQSNESDSLLAQYISYYLESDEEEKWLLIELWLTIRGHSIAGAWLEYHKQYSKTNTMKSVGLR